MDAAVKGAAHIAYVIAGTHLTKLCCHERAYTAIELASAVPFVPTMI